MTPDTDSKVYISLLHKCINDTLGEIQNINIDKLKSDQEEFGRLVSWIYFDNYEKFMKNINTIFDEDKEELADLVKDLTNSSDNVKA
jgi:hypothetical protein|tara:strand:- start:122 stop:382 length:261 start_codon:yes stop_codon:yes gene_type:complete